MELKHPRYSRRIQSKSEPSHASQDSEAADDELEFLQHITEESASLVSGSVRKHEDYSDMAQTLRRVSAPAVHVDPVPFIPHPTTPLKPQGQIQQEQATARPHSQPHSRPLGTTPTPRADSTSFSNNQQQDPAPLVSEAQTTSVLPSGMQHAKTTRSVSKSTVSNTENEPPSQEPDNTLSTQRRASRGNRRGRGQWFRGRRGRSGNRGGASSTNVPSTSS